MAEPINAYFEQFLSRAQNDEFWAIRGKSIAAYASLEHSLCLLFSHLTEMKPDVACTVFYKIQNYRFLGKIFDDLLQKKYLGNYDVFWKSFARHVQELNSIRLCLTDQKFGAR
jgi:hypothetical protein